MGTGTKVRELVAAWQRADAGHKPSPADLCAACPELLPELQRQIDALRAANEAPAATAAPGANEPAKPRDGLPRRGLVRIEGYHILRELGRGGQAVVYEAVQKSTTRRVAVKVLLAGRFATTQERRRLEREAQVLAAVNHPNVVQVIDRGTTRDGFYYLVMEYVVGRPLNEWMDRRHAPNPAADESGADAPPPPPADPAEALRLFLKICHAVNAAHLRGIVHRDLKPGNIYIDDAGEPHVLDFGLARAGLTELADPGDGATPRPITVTGQFLGSLPWASPEQAEGLGSQIDARTDVYSLGVILYQLLTGGRFPYNVAGTMREVMDNILKAQPIPPSRVLAPNPDAKRTLRRPGVRRLPQINPVLEAIALKALGKRREDRYQSAGEMARDIEQYLAGKPTLAAPAGGVRWRGWRDHGRLFWLGAAAAVLLLTLAVAGTWHGLRRPTGAAPTAPDADRYVLPAGKRVVELLPLVDVDKDAVYLRDGWLAAGGQLTATSSTGPNGPLGAALELPYRPAGEYDVIVEFTPTTGEHGVLKQDFPQPGGGRPRVSWALNAGAAALGNVRGLTPEDPANPTRVQGAFVRAGRRNISIVEVRKGGIRAFLNGVMVCRYPTDYGEFTGGPSPDRIKLFVWQDQVTFHRAAVVEVTGPGTFFRGDGPAVPSPPPAAYVQPAGRVVELLPLVRLPADALRDARSPAEWRVEGGELVAPPGNRGLVRLPYRPPAEYDYRVEFTRTSGRNGVKQLIPNPRDPTRSFGWSVGAWGNTRSGFDPVKGLSIGRKDNPTVVMDGGLRDGGHYTSVVQVRRDGVRAFVDGRLVSEWKTDYADLLDPSSGPNPGQLEILTWDSGARFHRIAAIEVSGAGELLRTADPPTTRPADAATAGPPFAPATYAPPVGGTVTEILPAVVALAKSGDAGKPGWEVRGGELVTTVNQLTQFGLPYSPPAEYDLVTEFTYLQGPGYVEHLLPHPSGVSYVESKVSSADGPFSGFGYIKGRPAGDAQNPSSVPAEPLKVGRRYTAVVQVRKDGLRAYVDGRLAAQWRTDYSDLAHPYFKGRATRVRLQTRARVVFHRVAAIEVSGRGVLDAAPPAATRPAVDGAGGAPKATRPATTNPASP